jgi:acyl dehydratase
MRRYFEAIEVGETDSFGHYVMDREEMQTFASKYDPQPFHLDEAAAAESMFGGLVASGWHTAAATMRLLVDNYFAESRALGAVGVDELRFPAPVRPGDELSVAVEVIDTEPWDEGRGLVESRVETTTEDGRTVLTMIGKVLWEREAAESAASN